MPTHPPGHNHGDWFNQALEGHQLVEAEDLAGRHVQPILGHDTYGGDTGLYGDLSVPAHGPMFSGWLQLGAKTHPEDRGWSQCLESVSDSRQSCWGRE